MAESKIDAQRWGDVGRSWRWRNSPFEVPDRIQTAGSLFLVRGGLVHSMDEGRGALIGMVYSVAAAYTEDVLVMMVFMFRMNRIYAFVSGDLRIIPNIVHPCCIYMCFLVQLSSQHILTFRCPLALFAGCPNPVIPRHFTSHRHRCGQIRFHGCTSRC